MTRNPTPWFFAEPTSKTDAATASLAEFACVTRRALLLTLVCSVLGSCAGMKAKASDFPVQTAEITFIKMPDDVAARTACEAYGRKPDEIVWTASNDFGCAGVDGDGACTVVAVDCPQDECFAALGDLTSRGCKWRDAP